MPVLSVERISQESQALRHINNMDEGRCPLVRYIDYIAGRQAGQYPPPLTPSRLLRRKSKTVADSSRGEISYPDGFGTNNRSEHLTAAPTATNPLHYPVAEAVRDFKDVEKTYTHLLPLIIVNTSPTFARPS